MTDPASSEQTLRESVAPPSRGIARLAGIPFVVTFISIPALPLYDQVLNNTDFIVGGGGDARVYLGALFELITLAAGVGVAVTLYPVLRRQSEGLALGYVTVRVFESTMIAVGIVSLLAVVTLRQDLAGGAGTDEASLILSGRALVAVHDATFLLGPAFCAAIGNGLMLGYMLFARGSCQAIRPVRHRRRLPGPGHGPPRPVRRLRPDLRTLDDPDAAGGRLGAVAGHLPDRQGIQALSDPLGRGQSLRRGRPSDLGVGTP